MESRFTCPNLPVKDRGVSGPFAGAAPCSDDLVPPLSKGALTVFSSLFLIFYLDRTVATGESPGTCFSLPPGLELSLARLMTKEEVFMFCADLNEFWTAENKANANEKIGAATNTRKRISTAKRFACLVPLP